MLKTLRHCIHPANCWRLNINEQDIFHAQLSLALEKIYNLEI